MNAQMFLKYILYLSIIMMNDCSSSLLERLRRHKAIEFQASLSSPNEIDVHEGSIFRLTCTFLSNFDQIDVFWLHNDTLIQSFISKSILVEEDDNVETSFLAVTIISTIEIESAHLDIHGSYQCIGVHNEIYSQHVFNVHVIANETNSIETNFSEDALITVHTFQSLFEPRSKITLLCRFGGNRKDQCTTQWFNPDLMPMNLPEGETDLILKDATFEDHMGLYTCQICCQKQCQTLTSFVYPAGSDK